jgi:chromosomal replication initiation ATPase DnaA
MTAAGATVVSVLVPNRFKLDWIRNQYAGRIEAVLSDLAGKPVRLEITLAPPRRGSLAQPRPPTPATVQPRASRFDGMQRVPMTRSMHIQRDGRGRSSTPHRATDSTVTG